MSPLASRMDCPLAPSETIALNRSVRRHLAGITRQLEALYRERYAPRSDCLPITRDLERAV
jgi:hypothetical protein